MFNRNGVPFFIIIIPFICIVFSSYFTVSYYIKVSNEQQKSESISYKKEKNIDSKMLDKILQIKKDSHKKSNDKFIHFIVLLTIIVLFFLSFFTIMMFSIINTIVKKYINEVEEKENKLQHINQTLEEEIALAVKEADLKNKMLLQQSKLAIMGSMISMIAHQWRQPLSELTGLLMELELATKLKKVDDNHIFNSVKKSNVVIDFMSNTIDDFRNFYRRDKVKEYFFVSDACNKALNIVNAALSNLDVEVDFQIKNNKKIYGYPREYSQVILNIMTNAKDTILERKVENAKISILVDFYDEKSVVTIKDNAKGISESIINSIFDPYFTTKKISKGTGLGLYVSKMIIEKNMNGELSVSNDREGAIFSIIV